MTFISPVFQSSGQLELCCVSVMVLEELPIEKRIEQCFTYDTKGITLIRVYILYSPGRTMYLL